MTISNPITKLPPAVQKFFDEKSITTYWYKHLGDVFNPKAKWFTLSMWEDGELCESHENISSVQEVVLDKLSREPDEAIDLVICDAKGQEFIWKIQVEIVRK